MPGPDSSSFRKTCSEAVDGLGDAAGLNRESGGGNLHRKDKSMSFDIIFFVTGVQMLA